MAKALSALLGTSGAVWLFLHRRTQAAELENEQSINKMWDFNWDRRSPENMRKPAKKLETDSGKAVDKPEKPTASRHLIFIRHGQYDLKPSDDKLRCLTELGRSQATLTGQRLKEFDKPYTRLVVSTLTRARETTNIICGFLPDVSVETCEMLAEGAPCHPEPPSHNWKPEHYFFQDGARIEAAFRKFFYRADVDQKEDSYEIFVGHSNVIRYFVCRALQLPPESWLRISLANCSVTRLTIRPSGRVSLQSLGDAGHLPPDKITYN
ncbi:serine/threonine-protein phosphatase PGAM5, mitochondrial-like isoform X2 [Corticium candelabrum]|uniref:serine/threonine-protein phosphatase PGAM5, mitochondrial-like isoform X2 n=1 Tax=Corticium candelabrum TaxID=121492 RepID=UPI002E272E28|nr:serine/threonine-protein phosphatase PGAM5, mitochondrial-like isoform X2 [Corticium candelabrum]